MTAGKVPSDQEVLFSIELLTIPQVAEWARVSTKTIYRWIESGKIPAGAVIEQLKQAGYEGLITLIAWARKQWQAYPAKIVFWVCFLVVYFASVRSLNLIDAQR